MFKALRGRLLVGLALSALGSLMAAGALHAQDEPDIYSSPEPYAPPSDAPPYDEILTTLQNIGLDPINEPVLQGPYYVLHAYDPNGIEMRVVADAELGDILSIDPAGNWSAWHAIFAPHYRRGPRIIHIPERSEVQ